MINLNILKKIKRTREEDNRNFKLGIRSDRNEKVENWPQKLFKKIFNKISNHEFTSYYNTKELFDLENQVAKYFNIKTSNFIINHGGDGIIKEFLLVNYKKNLKILINSNNYGMYKVYFKGLNIKFFEIPYKVNLAEKNLFNLDKSYLNKKIKHCDAFFFTNPNVVSNFDLIQKDIENFCKKYSKKLFFIDESYNGFGHFSFINLIKKYKNIYILRSATKSFGLASARVGFLISHQENIKSFKALQTPYPVSLFSGKCLKFFLDNKKIINSYNRSVINGREYFCRRLEKMKYFVNNNKGLSVLINFKSKKNLNKTYENLLKKNIYTKKIQVNSYNFLRVTCAPKKTMKKILNIF
jgi:histidinol-phosphate aminotransferase